MPPASQTSANIKSKTLARQGIPASWLIIKLKDSIMKKNTNQSSVPSTLRNSSYVTMVTTAHSLTRHLISRLGLSTRWRRIRTSTCSISRRSGACSIKITTRLSATMRTTGRTFGESLIFSTSMLRSSARIGHLQLSSAHMRRDATFKEGA
jgi:hypothetical protein